MAALSPPDCFNIFYFIVLVFWLIIGLITVFVQSHCSHQHRSTVQENMENFTMK